MALNYLSSRNAIRASVRVPGGFTLLELLVVIALIALLSGLILPAFARARAKAKSVPCASNMKNWAYATLMYLQDYDDRLPPFGDSSTDYTREFWHAKLSPYIARGEAPGRVFGETDAYHSPVRQCPAGSFGPPPFGSKKFGGRWNCWIGANFGGYGETLSAPFFYADFARPLPISRIDKPSDAMAFMDVFSHFVYSPAHPPYRFERDFDGDGTPDGASNSDLPFSAGRPTVHNNGANVTLLDGHVERIPFRELWRIDSAGEVTHPYWRIDD